MIFLDLLAIFGLAWVIADSKISMPFRTWVGAKLGEKSFLLMLLECPPCLSFWIAFLWRINARTSLFDSIVFAFTAVAVSILAWSFVSRGAL